MQTVVCSQRPAMVGKMPMVTALWRVLRLLRCALAFLVASENAHQRRVFGWVRECKIDYNNRLHVMREQTYSITSHIQRYSCEQHGCRELQMSPQMERVMWRQARKLYESCYRWCLHICLIDNVLHVLSPNANVFHSNTRNNTCA